MTRVGIISDTHGKLPDEACRALEGSDRIIHAGDICDAPILWELETIAPVTAVLGNNDYADFGSSVGPVADVTIDGVRFIVAHEPRHLTRALRDRLETKPKTTPLVAVHGHTHVPKLERGSDMQRYDVLLCPGAVMRSREPERKKTVAIAEVHDGKIDSITIHDIMSGDTWAAIRG
ncbi:MAG: metallophosphoesterase family protein [Eggerthellaceae bacterium]|nr:metallophosphoesterase family protein [Eggerthellaceae bacterium]